MEAPPKRLRNRSPKKSFFSGSKLRSYFSPFVDQISPDYSTDAREIAVWNAVFWLSISCSVPEIFAIEVASAKSSEIAPKSKFFGLRFFWGDPQILTLVFKIASISDHVAKIAVISRETAEISHWRKKKETAAKHKGSPVALSQRAALINYDIIVWTIVIKN